MISTVVQAASLACVPSAIPAQDRAEHFTLARQLLVERATERADVDNGYAFRFEADAFVSLARFVENERLCCPFMTFELVITPQSGPLWLRMTGPDGTREVLRAEFNFPGSCSCNP